MKKILLLFLVIFYTIGLFAQDKNLEPVDIFDIEYVSDPQVSPDGSQIIYSRNFKDIMTDRSYSNLWIINKDGSGHRPLTTGHQNDVGVQWAPDGEKIVFRSNQSGSMQIYMMWLSDRAITKLSNLQESPGSLSWSADGNWIAFTKFVPGSKKTLASVEGKPKGAEWNDPAIYIDELSYRSDGRGYLSPGNRHIFIMSVKGGTARQITKGDHDFGNPSWSADGNFVVTSANLSEDEIADVNNSEVYKINIQTGEREQLTTRKGPDSQPKYSPDGNYIAYTGFDERYQGHQGSRLYVMNADGSEIKNLTATFDRSIGSFEWGDNSDKIYVRYNNEGDVEVAEVSLDGKVNKILDQVGGLSLGRPYAGGAFNISGNTIGYTSGSATHPSDLGVYTIGGDKRRLTELNSDLFAFKNVGEVEEIWYKSSYDGKDIQGWICKPPGFDPNEKYPLILEIHGGPFSTYGPWFSMEVQLYAAAGYVVLYTNPRGSTSYGEEFANLIHHNYPSEDYDDLISGVDAVIDRGYVDPDQLFVTGGSGGGVLTAWIVGKTDRFKAAVVAKPVINWYSFVLYADATPFFYRYWFPGLPWDHPEHYMARSPISLVGNVTTPTMLLTGESDFRTPIAESEQYYTALKLEGVESAMVRIPGASHGIASRPSNLMAKVVNILAWFDKYRAED